MTSGALLLDSAALLGEVFGQLRDLSAEAEQCRATERASSRLHLLCKHIAGDLESCLDYAARDLVELAGRAQRRPSFPISDPARSAADFPHMFDSALSGVRHRFPEVYDIIESEQCFADREHPAWLSTISKLANWSKHNEYVSAHVRVWLHLRLNDLHILTHRLDMRAGGQIRAGSLVLRKPGLYDGDHLPEIEGEGQALAERLVDFEMLAIGAPMEWVLIDATHHTADLLVRLEAAIR